MRLLGPGLATAVMLAILIALGTWQVQRLAWKRDLLARIDAAESAPAIALPAAPAPFQKVSITGRYRAGATALFGVDVRETMRGEEMGARILTPLDTPDGTTVLVDRGWVPLARLDTVATPEGEVTVEGYIRAAEQPHWFSPADDPAARRFYTLNPARIGAAMGLARVAPFTLIAFGPAGGNGFPDPAHALPRPPNDHLSYAITWYSLAAVLLVVFCVWSRRVLRP